MSIDTSVIGNWVLDEDGWQIIVPRTNPHHCDEVIFELPTPLDESDREPILKDARLATAAPKLLAALLMARIELGQLYAAEFNDESYNNPEMNAIIAEALGE